MDEQSNINKNFIEQIIQSMEDLLGYHRQLLDVMRDEHKILISSNTKELNENTAQKEALLYLMAQVESRREKWVVRFSEVNGIPFAECTAEKISHVCSETFPSLSERIKSLQNVLGLMASRCAEQNQQNKELIQQALFHIEKMKQNLLGATQQSGSTYNQKGMIKGTSL